MSSNNTGKLEFNLEDYEAMRNFKNAINGTKYKTQIDTLYDEVFRKPLKYGNWPDNSPVTEAEQETLLKIYKLVSEHFQSDED